MSECAGCGNKQAYHTKTYYTKDGEWTSCDRCESMSTFNMPDVFVSGKPEENLPDDPVTGKPPVFASRREKAAFLKKHNLIECFGKERGGPALPQSAPPPQRGQYRHEAMMALKRVRELGQDVRRQQYLKIVKEGRNHGR